MWDPQSGSFSQCRTQHMKQVVGSSQLCVVTEWDITLDLAGTGHRTCFGGSELYIGHSSKVALTTTRECFEAGMLG